MLYPDLDAYDLLISGITPAPKYIIESGNWSPEQLLTLKRIRIDEIDLQVMDFTRALEYVAASRYNDRYPCLTVHNEEQI